MHTSLHLMTYCAAAELNAGLVFLPDSRLDADLNRVYTFRKLIV